MHNRRSQLKLFFALLTAAVVANAKDKQMDERSFWSLVDAARNKAGDDVDARPNALELELGALDIESLQAFQRTYESLLLRANRWNLWGAAYLMNGGASDDGFKYFRDWLISEGKGTFERALEDPESLAAFAPREYFELEAFGYAAARVYERKGGGELDRSFDVELAMPQGREWKESELPIMFPKLSARFGNAKP